MFSRTMRWMGYSSSVTFKICPSFDRAYLFFSFFFLGLPSSDGCTFSLRLELIMRVRWFSRRRRCRSPCWRERERERKLGEDWLYMILETGSGTRTIRQ
ncbi:hypothetical protein ASPZODRAFT_1613566 [Penicilliopsis zonata CBS 506.65]|uniref:Uncharacterized protein n=1 Tax=Penicilliopsis zonata CBS 506.65 TaxID=1073090 RepID=A0A1L9SMM5_9EURO|nr:hypothetical protein ASPZODRAFT_1613566 [Penicilliopsis zonata CBS 506.65]OJJ48522.1 hypothetical protein ASPZODRAFT_1613566 [Penicilliopsis zonata CBS 506.65]